MQVKFAGRARAKHPNVRRKQKPQQLNFDWTLQTGRPNCFIMYKGFLAMSKQNHCKLHTQLGQPSYSSEQMLKIRTVTN